RRVRDRSGGTGRPGAAPRLRLRRAGRRGPRSAASPTILRYSPESRAGRVAPPPGREPRGPPRPQLRRRLLRQAWVDGRPGPGGGGTYVPGGGGTPANGSGGSGSGSGGNAGSGTNSGGGNGSGASGSGGTNAGAGTGAGAGGATSGSSPTPEARLADAEQAFAAGRFDDALGRFDKLVADAADSAAGTQAKARAAELRRYAADAESLMGQAESALKSADLRDAEKYYARAAKEYGKHPKCVPAAAAADQVRGRIDLAEKRLAEAEALFAAAKYDQVRGVLDKVTGDVPGSEWSDRAAALQRGLESKLGEDRGRAETAKRRLAEARLELQELLHKQYNLERVLELARELEKDESARNFLNRDLPAWKDLLELLAPLKGAELSPAERVTAWEQARTRLRSPWKLPGRAADDFELVARAAYDAAGGDVEAADAAREKERAYALADAAFQCEIGDSPHHVARRLRALGLTDPTRTKPDFAAALDLLAAHLDVARWGDEGAENSVVWSRIAYRWGKDAPRSVRDDAVARLSDVIGAKGTRPVLRAVALKYRAFLYEDKGDLVAATRDLEQSVGEPENTELAECTEALAELLWKQSATSPEARARALAALEKIAARRVDMLERFVAFLNLRTSEPGMMDFARRFLARLDPATTPRGLRFWICFNAARAGHKSDSASTSDLVEREKWVLEALSRRKDLDSDELREANLFMLSCVVRMKLKKIAEAKSDLASLTRLTDRHKGDTGESAALWAPVRRQADACAEWLAGQ
ncbi:MAG: hypothetical protein HZA54_03220, partial [Planctomycetes bacterium]|nr:hypothetical protein [Planctomycetota bacterium]